MDVINNIYQNYQIKIDKNVPLTNKTYKIVCDNNNCFFIKKVNHDLEEKYNLLASRGVSEIIYPYPNKDKKYLSQNNNINYYISDYIENGQLIENQIGFQLFNVLDHLHQMTTIDRQLSVDDAKPKFEEITSQLDYKFKLIENYIRFLETKSIDKYSYIVLENYHILIEAKNEMIRLQKKIISAIKNKESVEYVFVHNNPKIEHLIMNKGINYLTSIDHGKIGINGLDLAKFYVENNNLKLDFKKLIFEDKYSHKSEFYYDYFCFLVIFIYLKRIKFTNDNIINMENVVHNALEIKNFMTIFLNKN